MRARVASRVGARRRNRGNDRGNDDNQMCDVAGEGHCFGRSGRPSPSLSYRTVARPLI